MCLFVILVRQLLVIEELLYLLYFIVKIKCLPTHEHKHK